MNKKETRFKGLDKFLRETMIEGGSILLKGPLGTGKTIFSLSILYQRCTKFGEKGLYIGANEPLSLIYKYLRENEFLDESEEDEGLEFINLREVLNFGENSGGINLNELISEIKTLVEERNPKLVVIDSIFSLYLISDTNIGQEKFTYRLVNGLRNEEIILFFISGEEFGKDYLSPFDTVIDFIPFRNMENSVVSKIRINKIRGSKFKETSHNLRITENEIEVYPEDGEKEEKRTSRKEETKGESETGSYGKRQIENKINKIEKIEKNLEDVAEFGATEEVMISFQDEEEFNEFQGSGISHKDNIKLGEPKDKEDKIWVKVEVSSPSGENI